MRTTPHGTLDGYTHHACRCPQCRQAMSHYHHTHNPTVVQDRTAMRNLLQELFPLGLTDDCPARQHANSPLPTP